MAETDTTKPTPLFQPASGPFATDEVLWWNNGRWGEAGYAIPNPGGKTWTNNSALFAVHKLIGRELFGLMHRVDVRMERPPFKEFLYDVHKLIVVARKRLNDASVYFNDARLDGEHATPAPKDWIVYPVPFFGTRIRQEDARGWCELVLLCLSEIMQHSDNEYDLEITDLVTSRVHRYLQRVLVQMATKFFGYTREQASVGDFEIPDEKFAAYDPAKLFLASELDEERPPRQWWPTENDVSPIRGIPISAALPFAAAWPTSRIIVPGEGAENVFPGGGEVTRDAGFKKAPGSAP